MLYGCDGLWWKKRNGVPEFKGLKICQDADACHRYPDLHKVEIPNAKSDKLLVEKPGTIGAGRNSGFQALNLAVQFGAMRVLLIGFDMHRTNGVHWHGAHMQGLCNPADRNFMMWRLAFQGIVGTLSGLGVEVVNASKDSALTVFPKMTIEEAMLRWGL